MISGGVNIYPAEIEAELHKMPGVADCAVFGIPDEEYGEAICAVVQPQPGQSLTESRRARLSARQDGRLQGAQAGRISRANCRARIQARSSSASCASPIGRAERSGSIECIPPPQAGEEAAFIYASALSSRLRMMASASLMMCATSSSQVGMSWIRPCVWPADQMP